MSDTKVYRVHVFRARGSVYDSFAECVDVTRRHYADNAIRTVARLIGADVSEVSGTIYEIELGSPHPAFPSAVFVGTRAGVTIRWQNQQRAP